MKRPATDKSIKSDAQEAMDSKGSKKDTEFIGKQAMEREFFTRFNEVMQIDKDKDIRMFRCIGDPDFSKAEDDEVNYLRHEFKKKENDEIEHGGTHRFEKILDYDLPIYESVMPFYKSSWDTFKNDA